MDLIEFLRDRLSSENLAELAGEIQSTEAAGYESVFRRVASKLKKDEEAFSFARSRLELRYRDLLDLPEGRRRTLLRNSSPVLLLVLFHDLIGQSWAERYRDVGRSLQLARVAIEVAETIVASAYLSEPDSADLLAEAFAYLGNAQRINSNLTGAEESLRKAEKHLTAGTGDRKVRADVLLLLGFLRTAQGRCPDAAALLDKVIALRRLLGDEKQLGFAQVQRGWVGCFVGEPREAITDYFTAGLSRIPEDHRLALQALHAFGEYLAREGHGYGAWKMLVSAEMILQSVEGEVFRTDHRWITGLAHRAVRELAEAERVLTEVRAQLATSEAAYRLALVSLDLASVYAAQGKIGEVRRVVNDAYRIFRVQGAEHWELEALVFLRDAVDAERASEELVAAVANFLARFPYNKALRFEWKDE